LKALVVNKDYHVFSFAEMARKLEEVYGNMTERTSEQLDESVNIDDPWEFFGS
jgi:hypothetical protein